jgi:general secretion pathway protein K
MSDGPKPDGPTPNGYAMVAAVAAMAVLSLLALEMMDWAHMAIARTGGELARARAVAAADAGVALAIHGVIDGNDSSASLADGRPWSPEFDGARLQVRLVFERGKIPINVIDESTVTRLFEQEGLEGNALARARDSLLDWLDEDDERRPDGAEAADYAAEGIAPRNGPLRSAEELGRIHGIGSELAARMAPIITVSPGARSFDPAHADPRAIAVMLPAGEAVTAIQRAREQAGARTALAFSETALLDRGTFTVMVDAEIDGAFAHREAEVEIVPGKPQRWRILKWN